MDTSPSGTHLPQSLEATRITALPPAAYYIADFITEEEEEVILQKVARGALLQRHFIYLTETLRRLKLRPGQDGGNSRIADCRPGPRI